MTQGPFSVRCALLVFEHSPNLLGTRMPRLELVPENLPRCSPTQREIPDEYRRPWTECQTRPGNAKHETAPNLSLTEGHDVLGRSVQHGVGAICGTGRSCEGRVRRHSDTTLILSQGLQKDLQQPRNLRPMPAVQGATLRLCRTGVASSVWLICAPFLDVQAPGADHWGD